MTRRNNTTTAFCKFLYALCIICPNVLFAQAPPGPLPRSQSQQSSPPEQRSAQPKPQTHEQAEQAPVRRTISGSWKFNRAQSDDARRKIQEAQQAGGVNGPNRRNGPYGGGSPLPGSGGPWGNNGPYGGNRGTWPDQSGTDDLQRMREVVYPPDSIDFVLKESEADLTDDQNRKSVFYTDGRKLQKPKKDSYLEIAAHWEGTRLVSEEKNPQGGELRRSFDVAPNGRQLFETVYVDSTQSRSSLVIHYVYDIAPDKP
jgi:hypothetical protein